MNKIILTIIITALLSSLITYRFTKVYLINEKSGLVQSKKDDNLIAIPTLTEKPTPKYSVKILISPIINGTFNLKVDIKNISLDSIAKFYLGTCKFNDSKGNEYKGTLTSPIGGVGLEFEFSKALFPGENQTIDFNRLGISLNGGGGIDWLSGRKTPRCNYDNSGYKVCSPVEGLKINECTSYVSTIERRWDSQYPQVVIFP